jgi:N-acetylglutamate synthase-like GNAT family acetyltransferase
VVLALWPTSEIDSSLDSKIVEVVDGAIGGRHQVWVAESYGRIIGSVGVIRDNALVAHLRYLSVAPDLADGQAVATCLTERAIRDAYERGYLKLVVHSSLPPNRLTTVLHNLGFEFSRERDTGGEHVLEFYQNLYERPQLPPA